MDPVTVTLTPFLVSLITEGIKEGIPAIISIMHQIGMNEDEVNAAWATGYAKFKTQNPNQLPDA